MSLDVNYKGERIAQLTQDGSLTLDTEGKYLDADIGLTYTGDGTDISLGITGASAGQYAKVKTVDGSGKSLTWEADTPSVPSAYTSNPAAPGTADPGSSQSWARGDHVHPAELPTVTSSDNGKVLRVVSGAWAAASLPSAAGVSF